MSFFDHRPQLFRVLFGILTCYLVSLAVVIFYQFGIWPSDENLFATPPSNLYITKTLPARMVGDPNEGAIDDSVRVGDLLMTINSSEAKTLSEAQALLRSSNTHPIVEIHRLREFKKIRYRVSRLDLMDRVMQELRPTAYVIDVTKGGASDRAGMKAGDLILRINGQSFSDIWEADLIMRQAQAGKTIDYDVLRDNQTVTLHVTLASFGVPFFVLCFVISGAVYVGVGGLIAFKRPQVKAARLLGIFFLTMGFFLMTIMILRTFVWLRDFTVLASPFFALPVWLHACHYFPKERPELIARRWIRIVAYGLMVVTIPLPFLFSDLGFFIGLAILLLYVILVLVAFRKYPPAEHQAVLRPVRWAGVTTGVIASVLSLLMWVSGKQAMTFILLGVIGLTLVLIPMSYLYTIGRYRLLDMELRIRRSIQYNLLASVWRVGLLSLFLWLLFSLSEWNPELPHLQLTGGSVELVDTPLRPDQREFGNNIVKLIVAVGSAFVFVKIGRAGLELVARIFHRTQYDYRRAASELAEVMATRLNMKSLAQGIVEKLADLMHLKRVGVLFFRNQRDCCCQEAYGFDGAAWKELCIQSEDTLIDALQHIRGEFSIDYLPGRLKEDFIAYQFQYLIPIRSKEKLVGTLLVGEKRSEATFQEEDLEFLSAAAKQASVAIENAFLYEELAQQERMKHELEIARRIQLESLPQDTPHIEGLDIAGVSIPAMEVGGDYFDYLNGSTHTLTVIVGDVSGKGTSAALYMSKVQGILRSLHSFGLSPRELFVRANRFLYNDLEKKSFVTAIGGAFDVDKHTLVLARAGHLPLFSFCGKDRRTGKITPKGLGLGLSADGVFESELEEKQIHFEPGDIFLFVSDGVTEGRRSDGEEFGEERLLDLLQSLADHSAGAIRDRIIDALKDFAAGADQHDDQTVVVVKAQ